MGIELSRIVQKGGRTAGKENCSGLSVRGILVSDLKQAKRRGRLWLFPAGKLKDEGLRKERGKNQGDRTDRLVEGKGSISSSPEMKGCSAG